MGSYYLHGVYFSSKILWIRFSCKYIFEDKFVVLYFCQSFCEKNSKMVHLNKTLPSTDVVQQLY